MKNYLINLLPRIKQFSQDLDRKEIFTDIPWVIIDEHQNQQKYIFKRNGELLMSLNGQVTIGKWEYLSTAKSLLIDRNADKILLNQNFIDSAIMILKKDGITDDNLILANEIQLPDLDVVRYLRNVYYKKNNIQPGLLTNGDIIELLNYQGAINKNQVTINFVPVPDGILELEKSKRKLVIEKSKIVKVLIRQRYRTNTGTIFIDQAENSSPAQGDFVYQENGESAPNGKYRLGFMHHIKVENGKIVK